MIMKKIILGTIFLLASNLTWAQSATIQYGVQQNQAGKQTQGHYVQLNVAMPVTENLVNDFGINAFQADVNKSEFNRFEDGMTYKYRLTDNFTSSIRGGLGYMESSNNGNWAYYTIEPKITANLPYGFDVSLAYRWRRSFNSAYFDDSQTARYALGYRIANKDYVRVMFDDLHGSNGNTYNNPNKTLSVAYTRNF